MTIILKICCLAIIALMAQSFLIPQFTEAQGLKDGFDTVDKIREAAGVKEYKDPAEFIRAMLNILLGLVAIVAAAAIIYAGFLMLSDLGEEDNVKKGKQIIKWAIIGLLVIGLSAIVVNVIINQLRA